MHPKTFLAQRKGVINPLAGFWVKGLKRFSPFPSEGLCNVFPINKGEKLWNGKFRWKKGADHPGLSLPSLPKGLKTEKVFPVQSECKSGLFGVQKAGTTWFFFKETGSGWSPPGPESQKHEGFPPEGAFPKGERGRQGKCGFHREEKKKKLCGATQGSPPHRKEMRWVGRIRI